MSSRAEKVLEEALRESNDDIMYFWAHLDMDGGVPASNNALTFWPLCDILNGGRCRYVINIHLDIDSYMCKHENGMFYI